MRIRKSPVRTCVVCRRSGEKKTLLRIVRTPAGAVEIDPTGKRSGRGAYLCAQEECRTDPQAHRQIARALAVTVDEAARAAIAVAGSERG